MIWLLLAFNFICFANAQTVRSIPEIGPHEKILVLEKNENPQNILIVYTKLDAKCEPVMQDGKPLIDFYWLMNGRNYKPVHPMIKQKIAERVSATASDKQSIQLRLGDLSELKQDLREPGLKIQIAREGKGCKTEALMKLGPTDGEKIVQVEKIHTESRKTMMPPFRKLVSVTLSGEKFSKTFAAK